MTTRSDTLSNFYEMQRLKDSLIESVQINVELDQENKMLRAKVEELELLVEIKENELTEERIRKENVIDNLKAQLEEPQLEENMKLERENKSLKREIQRLGTLIERKDEILEDERTKKENEIEILKAQLVEPQDIIATEPWMVVELDEIRRSAAELRKKMIEVYQTICDKGTTKATSTARNVRKQLTEEIEELERICAEISQDVKRNNDYNIGKIQRRLRCQFAIFEESPVSTGTSYTATSDNSSLSSLDQAFIEEGSVDYDVNRIDISRLQLGVRLRKEATPMRH